MRLLLFAIGALVCGAGHYVVANRDALPARDAIGERFGWLFRALLTDPVPTEVAVGLCALVLGSQCMAVAVGLPKMASAAAAAPAVGAVVDRWVRRFRNISIVLAVSAAVWVLGSGGSGWAAILWLPAMVSGLAAARAADRRRGTALGNPFFAGWECGLAAFLMIASLLYTAHDLTHWRWSGTPDESRFFDVALTIAEGRWRHRALSEDGVFDYHPVLSSYYQAAFMKLFGMNIMGWRLSSAAALAASLPFLYLLGRELCSGSVGIAAALLFGSARLAVGFAHLGYNNVQVYLVVMACLGLLAWAVRQRSVTGHYLAGCLAGLGWFTFYSARLSLPLALLVMWSLGALPLRRGDRARPWALLAGALLGALPLLARPHRTFAHMLLQTQAKIGAEAAGTGLWEWVVRFAAAVGAAGQRIVQHWLLSIFHGVWSKASHFQSNPLVDPVSVTLALVGLWLSLAALARRRGGARFIAPAYLFSALAVGAFSPYDMPPLTRLLFLSPLTALLAAFGLYGIVRAGRRHATYPVLRAALGGVVVATAIVWNAVALHGEVYEHMHGYGDGTTSELVRFAEQLPPPWKIVYLQRPDTYMGDVDLIMRAYQFGGDRFAYFRPFDARAEEGLSKATAPVAIVYELTDELQRDTVEKLLSARFPGIEWHDTDAGRPWSLRYLLVPDGRAPVDLTPDLPAECRGAPDVRALLSE